MSVRHLVYVELYLGTLGWVSMTSKVYFRDGITVRTGRGRGSERIDSASCALTFNNRDGRFDPWDPTGLYFDKLGQNTPLRWGLWCAAHDFAATVSNGWAATSVGALVWTHDGLFGAWSAADWAQAGGVGTVVMATSAQHRRSQLAGPTVRDVEVAVTMTLPFTNVTGGTVGTSIQLRGSGALYDYVWVTIDTAEQVRIEIGSMRADGAVSATANVGTLTHTAAQSLRIRAQADGPVIRGKVWAVGTPEPSGWHAVAHGAIAAAGWVAITATASVTNTNARPYTASFDDVEVKFPRFAGEVSEWPPRQDVSGEDRYSPIVAQGILRRLGQGEQVLKSAPRTYIPTTGPVNYWPCEDGTLARTAQPAVGTNRMSRIIGATAKTFGYGDLGPWLNKGLQVNQSDHVSAIVGPIVTPTEFTMDLVRAGGTDVVTGFGLASPGTDFWQFDLDPDFQEVTITVPPFPGTPVVVSAPQLFDRAPHHIRLNAAKSGANTTWAFYIDGVVVASSTILAYSPSGVERFDYYQTAISTTNTGSSAIGHVAFWNGTPPSVATAANVALGRVGEQAHARLYRVCVENGIECPVPLPGLTTTAMGPQAPKTLLDLIQECAATGLTVYEPKGSAGLAYRDLLSLCSQPVTLALDYAAKHLSELDRTGDDQRPVNDMTARRTNGGEYQYVQTTGRRSVLPPPSGVGLYDDSVTVNVADDDLLPDIASWAVHIGTVYEQRYPTVGVHRSRPVIAASAVSQQLLDTGIDDRLTIANAQAIGVYDTISQLARGYREYVDQVEHKLWFTCAPESPYHVFIPDTAGFDRADGDAVTTADPGTAGVSIAITNTDGSTWSTTDVPYDWMLNGERVTVTAMSAPAGTAQTATVTRSVNGVVKAHPVGSAVSLAEPMYFGRT